MDSEDIVVALTTFPADGDADTFARTLVEERLAACVNVLPPMRSTYVWRGRVESADERQVIIKTTRTRIADLSVRLKVLHPYEVPEFLVLTVQSGSDDYLFWIRESTHP